MKKLLLGALALSSLAVPASAAEVPIRAEYTAPVACTIDPPSTIQMEVAQGFSATAVPGSFVSGFTNTAFSQTGNTTWIISDKDASNDKGESAVVGLQLIFPNGDNVGSFTGNLNDNVLIEGARSGDMRIVSNIYQDSTLCNWSIYYSD